MKLLPESRALTGAEVGMVIAVAALLVLCCLGVTVASLFSS